MKEEDISHRDIPGVRCSMMLIINKHKKIIQSASLRTVSVLVSDKDYQEGPTGSSMTHRSLYSSIG